MGKSIPDRAVDETWFLPETRLTLYSLGDFPAETRNECTTWYSRLSHPRPPSSLDGIIHHPGQADVSRVAGEKERTGIDSRVSRTGPEHRGHRTVCIRYSQPRFSGTPESWPSRRFGGLAAALVGTNQTATGKRGEHAGSLLAVPESSLQRQKLGATCR